GGASARRARRGARACGCPSRGWPPRTAPAPARPRRSRELIQRAARCLIAPQGHAGAAGAGHEALLVVGHVALDEADRPPGLDHTAGGEQLAVSDRLEAVDLEF